jgi:hypothetical protein
MVHLVIDPNLLKFDTRKILKIVSMSLAIVVVTGTIIKATISYVADHAYVRFA